MQTYILPQIERKMFEFIQQTSIFFGVKMEVRAMK